VLVRGGARTEVKPQLYKGQVDSQLRKIGEESNSQGNESESTPIRKNRPQDRHSYTVRDMNRPERGNEQAAAPKSQGKNNAQRRLATALTYRGGRKSSSGDLAQSGVVADAPPIKGLRRAIK